jgi:hypothetical protein
MDFAPKRAKNPNQKDNCCQEFDGNDLQIADEPMKVETFPPATWPEIEGRLWHKILYPPGDRRSWGNLDHVSALPGRAALAIFRDSTACCPASPRSSLRPSVSVCCKKISKLGIAETRKKGALGRR